MSEFLPAFFALYLPHYVQIESAPFHVELATALTSTTENFIEIIGFRDSAKSTYATCGFPLQAALLGTFKFIVIINDTTEQVMLTIANIKHEMENNESVKRDFPNLTARKTWSKYNLLLSNGVRIIGRSRGQNIRGIRHRESRPDLIIVDDPENLKQVREKKARDETEAWFNAEVVPARSAFGAKLVVIGNMLHNDGFISRLSKNSLYRVIRIPVADEYGNPTWPARYPDGKKSLALKAQEVGATAWSREYMLKVVTEENQVILETDIQRYPNSLLTERDSYGDLKYKSVDAGAGVDLAISEKQTADFTAVVSGIKVTWNGTHVLIKPNPVKRRMNFDVSQTVIMQQADGLPMGAKFYVEDVGYQRAAVETLRRKGLNVCAVRPISDKRARLQSVAPFVKNGTVLFPETGCEDLIQSIINFGVEEHDDDVDAFVYLVLGLMNSPSARGVAKFDKI